MTGPDTNLDLVTGAFSYSGSHIAERLLASGRQVRTLTFHPDRPHPFTAAGNKEFNCLLWLPPTEQRAGDILLIDSTHFTTLFGGTDSLASLWRNLALMK